MSSSTIERRALETTLPITTSAATSTPVEYGGFSSATIIVPPASSITSLTFWVFDRSTSQWCQICDIANNPIALTVAAQRAYPMPTQCFAVDRLAVVGNAAGNISFVLKQ